MAKYSTCAAPECCNLFQKLGRRKCCSADCALTRKRALSRAYAYEMGIDAGRRRRGTPINRQCEMCDEYFTFELRGREPRFCPSCARDRIKQKTPLYSLIWTLKRFGLSFEDYEAALGRPCPSCGDKIEQPNLDHDHRCCEEGCPACFRAVLCGCCNRGLGQFKDDINRLRGAVRYLESFDH